MLNMCSEYTFPQHFTAGFFAAARRRRKFVFRRAGVHLTVRFGLCRRFFDLFVLTEFGAYDFCTAFDACFRPPAAARAR